jgi:hypothetical protein
MFLVNEDLARARMTERLEQAQDLRRGRQLAGARRRARRTTRAPQQARLVLARSL